LSLNTLRKIGREASEITKSVEFVLSGGEPLINPYALDFAQEAMCAGNDVVLLTNGTLIETEEMARRIAVTTKMVKISIDGSTEEVHSITRGKGNFDNVTRAVELLEHHGANVLVAMTVTKKNVHDIANMSARYGSRLTLQPLFKAGRGKNKDRMALTGEEYFCAMDAVDGVAPMGNVARVLESIRGRGVTKCALADREISISETGDVYPCQLLHAPEFRAGNIFDSSLSDIYLSSPLLAKMRAISVHTIDECSRCPIRYICAGGCRARDFYESGSVEAVGEFCEYEKLAFINGIIDYSNFEP
jgi:radical SAM protein with 4Fe4S-binding SPASM domain